MSGCMGLMAASSATHACAATPARGDYTVWSGGVRPADDTCGCTCGRGPTNSPRPARDAAPAAGEQKRSSGIPLYTSGSGSKVSAGASSMLVLVGSCMLKSASGTRIEPSRSLCANSRK